MKLPCVGETRASPRAVALQPRPIDERAGGGRNVGGHFCAIRDSEKCNPRSACRAAGFSCDTRATGARHREARRDRRSTRGRRPTAALHRFSASGFDRSRIPFRRGKDRASSPSRPASRTDSTSSPISRPPKCALPKMAPPTVPGVPAHASSPAMPRCIVQRTRPLIVVAASARTRSASICSMTPAARPDDEPAHAAIADRARSIRRRAASPAHRSRARCAARRRSRPTSSSRETIPRVRRP